MHYKRKKLNQRKLRISNPNVKIQKYKSKLGKKLKIQVLHGKKFKTEIRNHSKFQRERR